jgi:serine/threonine-protein kinase RsbW
VKSESKPESINVETWIPSEIGRISPFVDQIMRLIQLTGCVAGEELDVEIALREALNNAVLHGNRCDPDMLVFVTCRCEFWGAVSLIVRDEGKGFDPRCIPDAQSPEGVKSDHGRGIFLMKFYMDEVSFEKGGTEVHLRKHATRKQGFAPQSDRTSLPGSANALENEFSIATLPATHVGRER